MNETTEKLVKVLNELIKDCRTVYDLIAKLEKLKIKGIKEDPHICPINVYLKRELPNYEFETGNRGIYYRNNTYSDSLVLWLDDKYFLLRQFIFMFDDGRFPNLER